MAQMVIKTYKYRLPWYCPECKETGNIYFDDEIDIWLPIQKIAENHEKASPHCELWWAHIKIGEKNDTVSNSNKRNP